MDTRTRARRPLTAEQRARRAEYLRNYRKTHPDKARNWYNTYVLRRAARLRDDAAKDGDQDGRDQF